MVESSGNLNLRTADLRWAAKWTRKLTHKCSLQVAKKSLSTIQLRRLALGGQTVKNLGVNVIPTKVIASHRKSLKCTQVLAKQSRK